MSHVSKLLLLSCLASAFACTVPTIAELEAEHPNTYYQCNSDHKCPEGSVCFEEQCIRTADLGCIPGERIACGTDVGVCEKGSRLCGAEGTYGICEGEVVPSVEFCGDSKDNDCDGKVDRWDAFQLTDEHDLESSVAAVAVDRSLVGKPNTLLIATVEGGSLVIRTRTPHGVLSVTEKLIPPEPNVSYRFPTLVADKDLVVLAWVERTYAVGSGTPASHSVYLATLNGEGRFTKEPLRIPYGSLLPDLKKLTIAMNRGAILVLVTTTGPSPTGGPGYVQELWAATVARSLDASTVSRPNPVANPRDDFGPYATASSSSEHFVVAYEDGGDRKVITLASGGGLALSPVNLVALDPSTHSPFLVPINGTKADFILYYVRDNSTTSTSDLLSMTYTADPVSFTPSTLKSHSERIERMRMAVPPGERRPAMALWVSREAVSNRRFPYIVVLTPTGLVGSVYPVLLAPDADFGEELVLMPDGTRFMFYHHNAPLTAVPAVGGSSELYVQPFCGP
ncbi:hypothetical protein KYC5002_02375 [Archangium violaceum]|uniref:hypothetical protein n=1 Tax=Archangium violaceum TaxID=83451 RepID=UPI002B280CA1|nr:hypothetical protein KYC5002_02375 [Archangium gephyra]